MKICETICFAMYKYTVTNQISCYNRSLKYCSRVEAAFGVTSTIHRQDNVLMKVGTLSNQGFVLLHRIRPQGKESSSVYSWTRNEGTIRIRKLQSSWDYSPDREQTYSNGLSIQQHQSRSGEEGYFITTRNHTLIKFSR